MLSPLNTYSLGGRERQVRMDETETLELALHRALRGEVPPCVRAIVASARIQLDVFSSSRGDELASFEEVVESELGTCLGVAVPSAPTLSCRFLPADSFSVTVGMRVIYDNPWA
jgi:hypothetical protein